MKFDVSTEWRNFQSALIQELKATPIADFARAWRGDLRAQTKFYGKVVLPKVARHLGYQLHSEFLSCHFVIANTDRVPVVFIESGKEQATTVSPFNEIDKLCAVSSPVRVLFLSCGWAEEERDEYLPRWKERLATHNKYSNQDALYMIVAGEWAPTPKKPDDDVLHYTIESFDTTGAPHGRPMALDLYERRL